MGITIHQNIEKVKAAHQFQVKADLRNVELMDCSSTRAEEPQPVEAQLRLSLDMETSILGVADKRVRFGVRIVVHGDPKDSDQSAEKHLFEVSCRYALEYSLREDYTATQDQLEAFKEGNAIFHCWPYSRELIQNLTMRMGLPIPPLPFLRLAPKSTPQKQARKRPAAAKKAAVKQRAES